MSSEFDDVPDWVRHGTFEQKVAWFAAADNSKPRAPNQTYRVNMQNRNESVKQEDVKSPTTSNEAVPSNQTHPAAQNTTMSKTKPKTEGNIKAFNTNAQIEIQNITPSSEQSLPSRALSGPSTTALPVRHGQQVMTSQSSNSNERSSTRPTQGYTNMPPPTAPPRSSAFIDDRRQSQVGRGTIVPRSMLPSKRKSSDADSPNEQQPGHLAEAPKPQVPDIEQDFQNPDWYVPHSQLPANFDDQQHKDFLQLRQLINKREQFPNKQGLYNDHIRRHLHKLEHTNPRPDEVQRSRLLEGPVGLPRLFAKRKPAKDDQSDGYCPWDIRGDAQMLYKKWSRRDFDSELLRGIKVERKKGKEGKMRWVSSLKDDYPNKMRSDYIGEGGDINGLVNGQWFPNQLCAIRDGAHGSAQAGIYGANNNLGAYSIIVSAGKHSDGTYEDIDEGNTLYYCGTEAPTGATKPTDGTSHLRKSLTTGNPVRVLRTARMPNKTYAPSRGIRYDGLYRVVAEELLNPEKYHYRFKMERLPDQFPIRYQGIEKRPSEIDIERFDASTALRQGSAEAD